MLKVKISLSTQTHMYICLFCFSLILLLIFTYYIHNIGKTLDYGENTFSVLLCEFGAENKGTVEKKKSRSMSLI